METIKIHSRSEKPETKQELLELPQLPEFTLQEKIKGDAEKYRYRPSANRWYWGMVGGEPINDEWKAKMLLAQKEELPYLVSAVMERDCNLNCAHCLYQEEDSSEGVSREAHLSEVIEHIVGTMPQASEGRGREVLEFMSAGRILKPWHLDIFKKLRETRPDVKLGVIDNGTFTELLSEWPEGFKFDWIDISIDGTPMHHNGQRRSPTAYAEAEKGLMHAREVIKDDGYVASLMTLTTINAGDITEVTDTLLKAGKNGKPLVDKLKLTTMSPTNDINKKIEMKVEDFAKAWGEIKTACTKYNTPDNERISLGLYRIEDIEKLAAVIGERKFLESFPADADMANEKGTAFRGNFIDLRIDGVPVSYLPVSIWPPEELLIEADGAYRVAYEGQFTLDELHAGKSKDGRDTKPYTVAQLTPETDFREVYERGVDLYWQRFGHKKLNEEFAAFGRIRAKANK
ncbi:MAG: hypothetical protein WC217_01765 [Candidatus Paceibacterota bacterium]|jgi:sulfatase maturation enzyme AslB (radical SAM superfamily)